MKRKRQEGAIVIEATISLTTVMFLIVTILSIVNICLVQARIATLTHGIAKDISNYTYIYTMMGLNEKEAAISGKADYSRGTIDSLRDIEGNSTEIYNKISEVSKTVMDKEFWKSSMNLLAEGGINVIKGEVVDGLCKMAARKRLSSMGVDADSYLKHLGIKGGVGELNFEDSEVCSGGGDDIKIIVRYKVHLLELLGVDFDFEFEQCAYTKTWCARTGDDRASAGEGENASGEGDSGEGSGETEKSDGQEDSDGESSDGQEEAAKNPGEEPAKQKTMEEYVADSTHNASSTQVYLGALGSKMALGSSNESSAKMYGMTYFSMSDEDWNSLPKKDADAQWKMVKRFLEDQDRDGKNFYMGTNPEHASGLYKQEIEWLKNKGYEIEYDSGVGLWRARQK